MRISAPSILLGLGLLGVAAHGQPCEPHFQAVGVLDNTVNAMAFFDDGDGAALYVGGRFENADNTPAMHVARWDGDSWSPLGQGVEGDILETVRALVVHDDGSGIALYVAGALDTAGGMPANRIARWDGKSWTTLGAGVDDTVRALAEFDEDGDGPEGPTLFVGGAFRSAGGEPAVNIARWDGSAWSPVGGGVDDQNGLIRDLQVYDAGSGPALYATGTFTSIGGVPANNVARWNGASWSALGVGLTGGSGVALEPWDDGTGLALYVGGDFSEAGGEPADNIARWDGAAWSALGDGLGGMNARALAGFDDGSGAALYAGGQLADGGIHRWNGKFWQPVGGGLNGYVIALLVSPSEGLYVGGDFSLAGGELMPFLVTWTACPHCYPDFTGDGVLDLFDFLGYVNAFNEGDDSADCTGEGTLDLFDFLCFVNAFNEGCG